VNLSEQQKKQFVWALDRAGLTQHEIARHQMMDISQPTVSRWLNDYDPAEDGFEPAPLANGVDDEFTAEAKESYRDAVFQLLTSAGLAASIYQQDLDKYREMWLTNE